MSQLMLIILLGNLVAAFSVHFTWLLSCLYRHAHLQHNIRLFPSIYRWLNMFGTGWLQVLGAHFRAYIQALEKLQLDIATSSDLIGVDTRSTSLFSRGREPLKNRSAVFALGERINILKV